MTQPANRYNLRSARMPLRRRSEAAPRAVTHSLIATLAGPIDPQDASPLFATVPAEIRNTIFSLALHSYADTSQPAYPGDAFYCRPGYRFRRRIDTALLATCRRVYAETHTLPVSQNEHVFWCESSRGPPWVKFCDQPAPYFRQFTEEQKAAVVTVHFFAQLFWLEDGAFGRACRNVSDMRPKHLKITIRHTDWWYWETNNRLALKFGWGDELKHIQGLRSLELELETMERDKSQLETIVKDLHRMTFPLADSRVLSTEGQPAKWERYLGQSNYSERHGTSTISYSPTLNRWMYNTTPQMIPYEQSPSSANPDQRLPYVVSTLRWTGKAT